MEKAGAFKVQTLQMGWFTQFRQIYKLHFSNWGLLCENWTAPFTYVRAGICMHAKKMLRMYRNICARVYGLYLFIFTNTCIQHTHTSKHTIGPFSRCVVSKPPHSCAALEAPGSEGLTQTGSKQFPYTVTHTPLEFSYYPLRGKIREVLQLPEAHQYLYPSPKQNKITFT